MKNDHDAQAPESFLKEVHAVSDSEKQAAKLIEDAKSEAQKIISQAQADAVQINAKASKDAVLNKNKIIAKSREKTDAKIRQALANAQKKADAISQKRLSTHGAKEIAESVL